LSPGGGICSLYLDACIHRAAKRQSRIGEHDPHAPGAGLRGDRRIDEIDFAVEHAPRIRNERSVRGHAEAHAAEVLLLDFGDQPHRREVGDFVERHARLDAHAQDGLFLETTPFA